MDNLKSQIEAILFAAGEPVGSDRLAKFLKLKPQQVNEALQELKKRIREIRFWFRLAI